MDVIFEYLQLWDFLGNFELQPDLEDTHIWQFSTTGTFSIKSAYEALFTGAILFALGRGFGIAGPLASADFSCGL